MPVDLVILVKLLIPVTPDKFLKLTNIVNLVNPVKIVKLANLVMVKVMTDEFHDLAFNLSLGSRQQHTIKDNKRQ